MRKTKSFRKLINSIMSEDKVKELELQAKKEADLRLKGVLKMRKLDEMLKDFDENEEALEFRNALGDLIVWFDSDGELLMRNQVPRIGSESLNDFYDWLKDLMEE